MPEKKKPVPEKAAAPAKKAAAPAKKAAAPAKKAAAPAKKAAAPAKKAAAPAKKAAAPAKKAAAPAKKAGAPVKKKGVLAKKPAPPMKAKVKKVPTKADRLKRKSSLYKNQAAKFTKTAALLEKKEGKKSRKDKKITAHAIKRAAHLVKKAAALKVKIEKAKAKPKPKAKAAAAAPKKLDFRRRVPKAERVKRKLALKDPKRVKSDALKKKQAEEAKKNPVIKHRTKALKPGQYRVWRGTKEIVKKRNYTVKPIGGANNGNARRVLLSKRPAYYAAQLNAKRRPKRAVKLMRKNLRPSITPGTVCILLAGVHKGKRVVFLKRLDSGLCLVTGPFKVNRCPIRRVNQIFLIATATKIDVSKVEVPKHINDNYFRRSKPIRSKKEEGDIFGQKTEKYVCTPKKRQDQKALDKQVLSAITQHPDKKSIFPYLSTFFGLKNRMYPHVLKY